MVCCSTRKEVEILREKLKPYFEDITKLKIFTSREGDIIDLTFIINNHRLLILEILEYYNFKNVSLKRH